LVLAGRPLDGPGDGQDQEPHVMGLALGALAHLQHFVVQGPADWSRCD
jgi:hypothetical protein